ncbi:catalase [Sporomusa sphaeroides]|uniref:Catalase n=1 Tax=Sporomusa sphaeroides DSM 2875 TaxID=1337886 RepID=A0ABP2CD19_9FIRM|nr:catalase [Sporomusa sphaeroides]OLS57615.1 vegetative catalase [Sporomusa sphaeroides DSM 2875]CVK20689.1 Vegetative catalase [Sporomusa sphaeroides DSM 2875]
MAKRYLTSNQGTPVTDDQNSLTVGERGPILLEDIVLLEKITHFNRERIPERVLHAKGAGAFGFFVPYQSMASLTKAKFLQDPEKKTPVFVRFSIAGSSLGGADTVRDIRGFAVKFYTEEGNYDLIGNHLPVFPIRDPMRFTDLIHALKPNPVNNIRGGPTEASRFWDFMSLRPESMNFLTYLFSDNGIIKSYRTIQGYGVNTYSWVNLCGEEVYVKYHWEPCAGVEYIDSKTAAQLAGTDPDVASRDLFDTIAAGHTVEFEMRVQIMNVEAECEQTFDPLDPTKIWPENLFPLMPVGRMVLNKNPENFFVEVEQSAFSPAAIVPGIAFSNDRILQGRTFPYGDTQRYRIGVNYLQLPTNMPRSPVDNMMQDGDMQTMYNQGIVNYLPNTLAGGMPMEAPQQGKPAENFASGNIARHELTGDDYYQARSRYRTMSAAERKRLVSNIVENLSQAYEPIQRRAVEQFLRVDNEFGSRIAQGINLII